MIRFYQPNQATVGPLRTLSCAERADEALTHVPWCPLASVKKRKV
jgi:hypothetical protein